MAKRNRQDSQSSSHSEVDAPTPPAGDQGSVTDHDVQPGKYRQVVEENTPKSVIYCSLPPHQLQWFTTYEEHGIHHQQHHVNRCLDCNKNFPTEHFLNLHIAENHDPIRAARKERGEKTYACFVEGCDKTCLTWQKRRMHLVDKHHFPRYYDFFVVNDGMDQRHSMLRPEYQPKPERGKISSEGTAFQSSKHRESTASKADHRRPDRGVAIDFTNDDLPLEDSVSTMNSTATETPDVAMKDISGAMSSLRLVPTSIQFGNTKRGQGFSKR